MKPPLFTVTVAPLTVLPFQKTLFSYGYHEKLPPGTIVTIPLSGRTIAGVVFAADSYPNRTRPAWLKNIIEVAARPPLTEEQLTLAEEVSKMTFTPIGRVLRHFVPTLAKARKTPKKQFSTKLPEERSNEIQKVLALLRKEDTVFLPLGAAPKSLDALFTLVKRLKGQILVLAPDISTVVRLEKAWEASLPPNTLASLYHTKTPGQYFEAWNHVQEGKARIILATRHGLFAPFKNLKAVIQLDPADESYKQWDMSPRYHAQFVLPALQDIWNAKVIQAGVIPPLSVLAEHIPSLPLLSSQIQPEWINLKIERFKKNWSPFSAPLQEAIQRALEKEEAVILYVHQGGLESFSVCTECRTIFRCPNCQSALKLTSSDHYQCRRCGFKSMLFPQCRNCKSIHFKSVGYGTEKIAREAKKIFPQATVSIADKKHLENHTKVAAFLKNVEKNEPDILITTASMLRFPPLSRLSLTAIIDADTLLNLPGYRRDEQFVELVEKLTSLLKKGGRLLVQTYHPESDIFQKITAGDVEKLLQQLLQERDELRYPPVYRALALEPRPKKKESVALLKDTTKKLKALVSKHPDKKELEKALFIQSATRRERGKDNPYTLLRYRPPLHPDIVRFLSQHADNIIIDHDPLRIT